MHLSVHGMDIQCMFSCHTLLPVPFDCSVGEVKSQLSKDERLDTAGLYILLEGAQCNGSLVSWHTCGFVNPLSENVTSFQMIVEVYRENVNRSRYTRVRRSIEEIYLDRETAAESKGCVNLVLDTPFDILEGDLIAVEVSDQCENDTLGVWRCPLQPNLNTIGDGSVFYRETRSRNIQTSDLWDSTNWVNISINIKASIIGSLVATSYPTSHNSVSSSVSGPPFSSDKPTPVITSHNVMSTRDFTATVILTSSGTTDEAMVQKSMRGEDIQPGEIAGIIAGVLVLTLLVLFFAMYVYCRRLQKKKEKFQHTDGSVPVAELFTNYQAVSDPDSDNESCISNPEYMTADKKAVHHPLNEGACRETFRNRAVRISMCTPPPPPSPPPPSQGKQLIYHTHTHTHAHTH